MSGPLAHVFIEDHRRLGRLLEASKSGRAGVETEPYEEFRAGILRHIGLEERILIPGARRARGGEALPVARLLRLDHGAIASLLVPTPSRAIIDRVLGV